MLEQRATSFTHLASLAFHKYPATVGCPPSSPSPRVPRSATSNRARIATAELICFTRTCATLVHLPRRTGPVLSACCILSVGAPVPRTVRVAWRTLCPPYAALRGVAGVRAGREKCPAARRGRAPTPPEVPRSSPTRSLELATGRYGRRLWARARTIPQWRTRA
ncbi:hypothetical protein K466DRAFT_248417 [Polyporus arcularius HHB13444]|uniref:Uncharacterized protein n=1 Tax=Polyporus arcularius HHB13444 TaxID=1314778 RepID=A0A5C3Q1E3_9APHY|nr:hypothetical protein K466DRAFT_248417 [Polyporus arcularius HHB13444]